MIEQFKSAQRDRLVGAVRRDRHRRAGAAGRRAVPAARRRARQRAELWAERPRVAPGAHGRGADRVASALERGPFRLAPPPAKSGPDQHRDRMMTVSPQDQARILSEALPHMQQYDEEIVVVKYGGHAMGDEATAKSFARDIVLMEQTAINPVVVHGGGPQIGDMLKRLGIKSEFAAGLRITDKATIEIVEMVLAGSINKQIVGYINAAGGKAVGLSGKDGNMVQARKVTRTRGRSGFQHREGDRSRLRRRARQGRHHRARPDPRPRPDPGAGAGRDLGRRRAPTTSMPTPSRARSRARSRRSACCCSPTCRACSTSRSS